MILKDQNTRNHSAWTMGNGHLMQGICIPHSIYTSHMGTARVKEEVRADTRIMQESSKESGRKEHVHKGGGGKSQTRPK